ncbi:MAG: hypothetical protein HKN03_13695 [Acidimicrobiales bacterium]|nr:hypothetical protein [Acidimicrobiales bacterium]
MAEGIPIRVCYVLAYRDPEYVRTRTLIAALESLGHIQLTTVINTQRGVRRYGEVLRMLVKQRRQKPDVYILGFRGHELYWLVRMIAAGRPIIFDAFLSPSDVLQSEAKHGRSGQLLGHIVAPMERAILRNASAVLVDTQNHAELFSERFRVAAELITALPVGAYPVPDVDRAVENPDSPLQVLFYGSVLPLHGLSVVFAALERLENVALRLRTIGGTAESIEQLRGSLVHGPKMEIAHSEWVPLPDIIASEIPAADLCLGGPFGGTPQALRVVTGKTYQFLAGCRATVVGRTPDHELLGFADRYNCLIVDQDDPQQLADTIRWADENRDELPEIGMRGRELFDRSFTVEAIATALEPVLGRFGPAERTGP